MICRLFISFREPGQIAFDCNLKNGMSIKKAAL